MEGEVRGLEVSEARRLKSLEDENRPIAVFPSHANPIAEGSTNLRPLRLQIGRITAISILGGLHDQDFRLRVLTKDKGATPSWSLPVDSPVTIEKRRTDSSSIASSCKRTVSRAVELARQVACCSLRRHLAIAESCGRPMAVIFALIA